ncbi:MAG: RNA polymerase sigma factor [Planctomycetota bacterium]|jgi:RNA polymerase sigma factor (sigma-70 family)
MTEQLHAFHEANESVWRDIVERNGSWLYALSFRLLWDANEAEEAVQECFLRAFKKRGQLRDLERLSGWLRKICLRVCLRNRRKTRTLSLHEVDGFLVPADRLSPDKTAASREKIHKVLCGLSKLSARQRGCLILAVFEGLSVNEIAESMGIKEGTVKRYIFEARQSLGEYLDIDGRGYAK